MKWFTIPASYFSSPFFTKTELENHIVFHIVFPCKNHLKSFQKSDIFVNALRKSAIIAILFIPFNRGSWGKYSLQIKEHIRRRRGQVLAQMPPCEYVCLFVFVFVFLCVWLIVCFSLYVCVSLSVSGSGCVCHCDLSLWVWNSDWEGECDCCVFVFVLSSLNFWGWVCVSLTVCVSEDFERSLSCCCCCCCVWSERDLRAVFDQQCCLWSGCREE